MPTGEMKKLSRESGKSVEKIESVGEKLKKEAEKNSKVHNKYAYEIGTLEKIFNKKK